MLVAAFAEQAGKNTAQAVRKKKNTKAQAATQRKIKIKHPGNTTVSTEQDLSTDNEKATLELNDLEQKRNLRDEQMSKIIQKKHQTEQNVTRNF
jgi:hypothetical protein